MKSVLGIGFIVLLICLLENFFLFFSFDFPSAIILLIILTVIFSFMGRVPVFLKEGAERLFRVFPLLFIPALVGVAEWLDIVSENIWVLFFSVSVSSLLGLIVTAKVFQALKKERDV